MLTSSSRASGRPGRQPKGKSRKRPGIGLHGLALVLLALGFTAGVAAQWPPLPPQRPPELGGGPLAPTPAERSTEGASTELPPDEATCRQRLAASGVVFGPLPAIKDGACGAPHPLLVSRLPGGVTIGAPTPMTCALAEALATWSSESVGGAARERLGKTLTGIGVGTTYECRGQNRDPAARLSEHAFANGVDISGFAFSDGQRLAVGVPPQEAEAGFLAAVRASACTVFTTVLGPGSAGHTDHMHLDMRPRNGGYKICQ